MDNKRADSNRLDRILAALPAILTAIASVANIHAFCEDWVIELLTTTLAWSISLREATVPQMRKGRIEKALDSHDPECD